MATLTIKAPKATRVKSVGATSGTRVTVGDIIFELFDHEELALLSSLDRAIEENLAKLAEVTGPRPTQKLAALRKIVGLKIEASKAAEVLLDGVIAESAVGLRTTLDLLAAQTAITVKAYQIMQSAIEADVYEKNIADSAEVLKHVDEILRRERDYVDAYRKRLTILAPINGIFTSEVTTGDPVRLGSVLGTIR